MKVLAKKISSVLLCGLLIYNSLGYFLVFSIMRENVRQQKWAQLSNLPEEMLSSFIFSKKTSNQKLQNVNSREIRIDGKLYDIVRKQDNKDSITYFVVHDAEEETMIAKARLFNTTFQQMPAQNATKNIISKIIKTGIFTETICFILKADLFHYVDFIMVHYLEPYIQINNPPPQF